MALFVAGLGCAYAQDIQHLYDETGRLVGTVAPSGDSAYYTYDPAGNITATRRITAGAIDLAEFTPNSGVVGTTVTLWGSGFSTTASANSVRFNGTTATVVSATANKLVVTVPAGATTGPIAITSPSGTVTSTSNFTVLANNGAPTLASFTPTMGPPGTVVTITGSRFDTTPGGTRVEFNGRPAAITSMTATTLSVVVPVGSAGRIRVATVEGSVNSAADFLILPSGFSAADVMVSRRATVGGAAQTLNILSNKAGVLLFDGAGFQYRSVNLTAFTASPTSVLFKVYAPSGGAPIMEGSVHNSLRTIHLPPLPQLGTYAVYFRSSSTVDLSAAVIADPALGKNGTALNSSFSFPGQTVRMTMNGAAGKDWVINFSDLAITGASSYFYYTVTRPDGAEIVANGYCNISGSGCSAEKLNLPVSGTYVIKITPNPLGTTGTFIAKSWESSRVTGALSLGTTKTYTSTVPGQVVQYTFNGTAGQQLGAAFSNFTTSVAGASLKFVVLKPDNTELTSATITAATTAPVPQVVDIPALPSAGVYTVQVYPNPLNNASLITTFSGEVLVTQDVLGTLATDGTSTNVSINQVGQTARLSFNGTAGKDWVLNIFDVSMSGSAPQVDYTITRPDNTTITGGSCSPAGFNCSMKVAALPVTGTYTVKFTPNPVGSVGNFLGRSWESSPVTGVLTVGTSSTVTSTVPGQAVQYTFSGTAGQQLGMALSNFTTSVSADNLYVTVTKPDKNTLISSIITAASTAPVPKVLDLPVLPTTGTYTVRVSPYPNVGSGVTTLTTFSGQVLLSEDVAAVVPANGTPTNVNIALPGQTARLSFTGTAGTDWVVNFSGLVLTGTSPYINYVIKKPDGGTLVGNNCAASSANGCQQAAYPLPVTGTYTIVVTPYPAGSTGTFTVKSWASSRVTGALTLGTPSTMTSTVPGQAVQYTFTGTASQLLRLTLSNFTTSVSDATLSVLVLKPDATTLASVNITAANTTPTAKVLDVPVLPVTGTYTVRIYPNPSYNTSLTTTFSGQALLGVR